MSAPSKTAASSGRRTGVAENDDVRQDVHENGQPLERELDAAMGEARDLLRAHPLAVLGASAGFGLILGLLLARR